MKQHYTSTNLARVKSLTLSSVGEDIENRNTLNVADGMENIWHYLVN